MSRDQTTSGSEPSTNRRAADGLFRKFESMIMTGDLRDGEPLPTEREIVEKYGVSRTVVREAILALSAKGLVEARPRYRPLVRRPSYDTAISTIENVVGLLLDTQEGVKNLFDMRIMIEVSLVREAALSADRLHLEALRAALKENEGAISDSAKFYQTDTAFHGVLYQIPGNPMLPAIHKAYTNWLEPQWSRMPRMPERNQRNYDAHKAVFDAILMRDPDAAEDRLRTHLAQAWDQVKKTFENEPAATE